MSYATGRYTVFHHRYHIVWVPKYRYKVLEGEIQARKNGGKNVAVYKGISTD